MKISDTITLKADQDFLSENGVSSKTYDLIYRSGAPWESGTVQPEVASICDRGEVTGRVLDVGCGLGSNTRYISKFADQVIGVDFVKTVIEQAKYIEPDNPIDYRSLDIFDINSDQIGYFNIVFDSATLHGFSDSERLKYSSCLAQITKAGAIVFVLGISDEETRSGGPRRLSAKVIRDVFSGSDWAVDYIRHTLYEASIFPGGAKAVVAKIFRT